MDAAEGTVAETVDEGYSSREIAAETAGESEIEAAEEHAGDEQVIDAAEAAETFEAPVEEAATFEEPIFKDPVEETATFEEPVEEVEEAKQRRTWLSPE